MDKATLDQLEQVLVMCESDKGHNPGLISLPTHTFRQVWELAQSTFSAARPAVVSDEVVERMARVIYDTWAALPGFVPWVERGNSFKQNEARQAALRALALLPGGEGEGSSVAGVQAEPIGSTETPDQAGKVFVVMATSGDYSDRSEWPICAVYDEAEGNRLVDDFSARVAAALGLRGSSPPWDAKDVDDAWDRFWAREKAAEATVADLTSDLDTRFFVWDVPIGAPIPTSADPQSGEAVPALSATDDQNPLPSASPKEVSQ